MNIEVLLDKIAIIFANSNQSINQDSLALVDQFLDALEKGLCRGAHKTPSGWVVDERVKQGILLAFRVGQRCQLNVGPLTFIDKHNLWPRRFNEHDEVRIVPGAATVRRGAYLGKNVVVMPPSYVNIGAFVDDGTLVDSNALVGSCAQIGKRVHISAGAQIGGVLEPVGALPVILEDDVLVGGNCGIYEGTIIGAKAVIGAGVVLTKSTKVFDLVNEQVITAGDDVLKIPNDAVLVPGTRAVPTEFGRVMGLSLASPLIIKYRDGKTNAKAELEGLLR